MNGTRVIYKNYHRNCCRDLQKTRPTSNKELELLDLNKNTADKFITEEQLELLTSQSQTS